MTDNARSFPDWETLYKNQEVECMSWFSESLDPDLELELDKMKIKKGSFLDIGTGPGTQAIKLFERGFDVTASDLSSTSIHKASVRYNDKMNNKIKDLVRVWDILPKHHQSLIITFFYLSLIHQ